MESMGQESKKIYSTLHYGTDTAHRIKSGQEYTSSTDFSSGFHTYALEWEPNEMRWYVDSEEIHRENNWNSIYTNFPAPFDKKFYLILNLAIGGNWPGNPDTSTPFPNDLLVDYVAIYKNKQLPAEVAETRPTGCQNPLVITNNFISSGWMGDFDNISVELACENRPKSQPDCIRCGYTKGKKRFGGVYWQNIANNWGEFPGNNYQRCNYSKCSFWARGEHGNEIIEFHCGGINDRKLQYRDSFHVYKTFHLTKEWKQYEIDISKADLTSVIGGFSWVVAATANTRNVIFYIDDILYE